MNYFKSQKSVKSFQVFSFVIIFVFSSRQIHSEENVSNLTEKLDPDAQIALDKEVCLKNSSMIWNAKQNRCVGKVEDREKRHAAQDCQKLTDHKAKEACHLALAEKTTGMSSDPDSLEQGNLNKSMLLNGAGVAYTVVNLISGLGQKGSSSRCTSKNIFGITSMAGLATDFYLKFRAKKKIKELQDKYKIDTSVDNAREAQETALLYLKEEQETVAAIANMEKKRNLVLMTGYAAAAGMAIYEMTPMGQNPTCYKSESAEDKPANKTEPQKLDQKEIEIKATSQPTLAKSNNQASADKFAEDAWGLKPQKSSSGQTFENLKATEKILWPIPYK